MSRQDDEIFEDADDPAMRAAVRRAIGGETAPPALRRRIEAMLATPAIAAASKAARPASKAASVGSPMRWRLWLAPISARTLAAAVIAFLALGVMFYQVWHFVDYKNGQAPVPKVDFPLAVAKDMVKAHELCVKQNEFTGSGNAAVMATKLMQSAGYNVAVLNDAAGWEFKRGEESNIGNARGAQMLYTNRDQLASVFSMRGPSSCSGANSDAYRGTIDGHPVAGFVQGGIVYAVVISSNKPGGVPSTAELDSMVAQMMSTCTSGVCSVTHNTTTNATNTVVPATKGTTTAP